MQYVDCKAYAQEILDEVRAVPNKKTLCIITMGDNAASTSYAKGKIKDCEYCGIPYKHEIAKDEDELRWLIIKNNQDSNVGGIIIQLPLPEKINEEQYTNLVRIDKDVDGFRDNSPFKPCTPEGIMYLLHKEIGDLSGKKVLLIGKGKLVGRPLINMLLDEGCTLTIAHSKTKNLNRELTDWHDIVITSAGKSHLVDLQLVWAKLVVDAGISRDENGKLCGDCYHFMQYWSPQMKVTRVPGGIGLMTRAMLMKHMIK